MYKIFYHLRMRSSYNDKMMMKIKMINNISHFNRMSYNLEKYQSHQSHSSFLIPFVGIQKNAFNLSNWKRSLNLQTIITDSGEFVGDNAEDVA